MPQDIPFIEYVRPNGGINRIAFPVPDAIAEKAKSLMEGGYQFEIESLGDNVHVCLSVSLIPGNSFDLTRRICSNDESLVNEISSFIEDAVRVEQNHYDDPASFILSQYEICNAMPAFDVGRRDFASLRSCPYPEDSDDAWAWYNGFAAAVRTQRMMDMARQDRRSRYRTPPSQPS
jgi:hypothetical protein